MDLRQARHLVAVIEHGNVLRAANAIHLSQPALSKSIQNLEAELGVPLLERGPRGVAPTVYGLALLRHARLLLNQGDQAIAEIRAIREGQLGHLRLGVANFAIPSLPAVVAKLLASKPGLSIDVVDGTYEGLTELVREGALDAVVSGLPPVHRAEDLVHEELISTNFVLACRPDCMPFQPAPVAIASLDGVQWILPNRPQAIVDLWELGFRTMGVIPPRLVLQSASMMFIKALLMEGPFVTLLPRGIVQPEVGNGRLTAIELEHPFARVSEGIIYRPGGVQPPVLAALIEAIRS
ncbi:LysR family transcriptional regulator [Candidatus Binatia bacterium]|nr:LysR family transcriptional regulator [Candidatus Binatia bacterium]